MSHIITMTGHKDCDYKELSALLMRPDSDFVRLALDTDDLVAFWGGAQGADITFALACRKFAIPMELFLPDPFYVARSVKNPDWLRAFNVCKDASTKVHYSGGADDWRNNFVRNEDMIKFVNTVFAAYRYDDIDEFTATFRPRKGGTASGIQMAKKYNKPIIHLKVS